MLENPMVCRFSVQEHYPNYLVLRSCLALLCPLSNPLRLYMNLRTYMQWHARIFDNLQFAFLLSGIVVALVATMNDPLNLQGAMHPE